MFVRRERGETLEDDLERTRRLVDDVREREEPGLRVWSPPPHVSFGRRDANSEYFQRARTRAEAIGYATAVRSSGGRAVVHTAGTLAILLALPIDDERRGIEGRYEDAIESLQAALNDCGVDAVRGEPPESFCPGSHSLQVDGRKVIGLAQRVRSDIAVLAGIVIVDDPGVDVLAAVYDALEVPFDPESVGSLADGGVAEPTQVGDAIVAATRGDAPRQ